MHRYSEARCHQSTNLPLSDADPQCRSAMPIRDARSATKAHEATLMHETTAIGQLTKLQNRDLAPRRPVNWAYRIGTLSKPFDQRYVFFSSLASLIYSSSYFSLLLLSMAIATREWRRRRFFPRGFSLRVRLDKFRRIMVLFLLSFLLHSRPGVLG